MVAPSSRWKIAALSFVTFTALLVPLSVMILQHRLQAQPHDQPRPWNDPVIAKKLDDARLAKAKAIREEWRPWALKHKIELREMLESKGQEISAALDVYRISPPLKVGDWCPDTRTGPVKFDWVGDPEKMDFGNAKITFADEKTRALYEQHKGWGQRELRRQFKEMSDYIVANSSNPGPSNMQLWASGRITRCTIAPNPDRGPGQIAFVTLPYEELVPPYDFLTEK